MSGGAGHDGVGMEPHWNYYGSVERAVTIKPAGARVAACLHFGGCEQRKQLL